jgi:hypothetical protein
MKTGQRVTEELSILGGLSYIKDEPLHNTIFSKEAQQNNWRKNKQK